LSSRMLAAESIQTVAIDDLLATISGAPVMRH
jgi:hypothetical protein